MTSPSSETEQSAVREGASEGGWTRVVAVLQPALVPLGACVATLLLLSVYAATGAAGRAPAEIRVTNGRIHLPGNAEATAAFFDLRNDGGTADTLVSVESPSLDNMTLTETITEDGAGRMQPTGPVAVPAHSTFEMTPYGLDVMVPDPPDLELGEKVPFVLWFRDSGAVQVEAVTVRPGT